MLKSLFIRNFVLIEHLDIRFDNGFSVITGETGAGKSIPGFGATRRWEIHQKRV